MTERTTRASEIGGRIRIARTSAGFTQESLAHKVGVVASTVRGWDIGERIPPADRVADVASACGVSIEWLLTGEGAGPGEAAA